MINMMKDWQGQVQVNGNVYDNINSFIALDKPLAGDVHIVLYSKFQKSRNEVDMGGKDTVQEQATQKEYRITVKKYMTQKTERGSNFTFMKDRNNDVPMPLRVMTGTIEKQTPGMYFMKLHGDIWAEKISVCMCCGRKLTNPVSQYFGIGPECGNHGYVNPFDTEEELKEAVAQYRKQLQAMVWEGWVIKSAITEMEEV